MKRINAIYARQSVDRADSISIESQIEFCKYELKGGAFREYKDKGIQRKEYSQTAAAAASGGYPQRGGREGDRV